MSRRNAPRQGFDGIAVDVMLCIYGGDNRPTSISRGCGIIYSRLKSTLGVLVSCGYVFVVDGCFYLTEKGLSFVSFVLKNWDIFMNDSHLRDDFKRYG